MLRRHHGFTMIEVLIAMLVLGTGAMAMVMLQLQALRSSRDSALHGRAMMMAIELAELRAEYRDAARDDEADPYLFTLNSASVSQDVGNCDSSSCASDQFARSAIAGWTTRLSMHLPGGRAQVCRDDRSPATVGSTWTCQGGSTAPVYIKLGWRGAQRTGSAAAIDRPRFALFIGV